MKSRTAQDYHGRMTRVLDHLARHLDDRVALGDLAAIAAFSPFHFHRIFRSMAGETVGDLVRRLKLERAAYHLRNEGTSVTEAAFAAGYESPESFARAFRRCCGLSPTAYRRSWPPPPFARVLPRVHFDPAHLTIDLEPVTGGVSMNVRFETFPRRQAVSIRLVGPYNEAAAGFSRLIAWAETVGIDWRQCRLFSQSYDDPDFVPTEALRSDACLELLPDGVALSATLPDGADLLDLPACRYAIHRLTGSYDGIHASYQRMFRLWLPTSGEELAEWPCMEIYLNDCANLPAREWLTELCIPLRG